MKYLLTWPFIALTILTGRAYAAEAVVQVSHAWIRLLPGDLPAGGYATLRNAGGTPLALIGARSPDYREIMLHESTTRNGLSKMAIIERLRLPPHATVTLAPGGYHLMLMDALHPIKPGDHVKVTLRFANGDTLESEFIARPANAGDDG
jgi:periplasmic copper chaperone A